ncbi:uncharacterized protein LOC133308054 [Gastrolobium bilobum]|uniref:uncharacterized protein LOC133308054 n=1 Tax=Gastrolobium bilobum TaxID=150636 RepID=UPI002AAF9CF0|nr:uncharacterized protein LOC133308054 [Gastrolobium bilobum]
MSSKYDFVKDLNPTKEEWRIKVRVVRYWKVPSFNQKDFDDNVDMVLVDERLIVSFVVVVVVVACFHFIGWKDPCYGQGPTRHEYHLSFNLRTDVKSIVDAKIPERGFDFAEFDVIEKESSDSPYLIGDGIGVLCYALSIKILYIGRKAETHVICCVDVIGLLSGIGEVREHVISGRNTKMVVVELDNLRGQKLECTLRESYVDEVQTFLAKNQSAQNVIILQLARIKGFRGFPRKFLTDIKNCIDATTCITYGIVKSIESKYNWWYKSCKECPYSVCEDFEKWYCKNCQKHWNEYTPKFSVQVRVVDNTDSASFVLFDRDCLSLLGVSAAELREQHFKRGADLEHYPEELNVLKDRSMLFKVNVKISNLNSYSEPKYHVAKVCISESIITSFLKTTVDPNDVQSQTCDSTDDADISLTLLSPSMKYGDVVEDKNNC